jgi:acyl-[acyl-carrier-protein]-phospholipid O-acyltransferase/long-chain-fatty-acid--[acyl-carrier-protein] ligase
MFQSLMKTRRFAPLFWCQLLSALNDNLVKNTLVMLILFQIGSDKGSSLVTLAGAVLIVPFFLLSGLGGELADRYDKAWLAQRLKLAEIPVSAIAALGFVTHSIPLLFVALAGFGVIAALFGPIKYGILPVHLETEELPAGNALVEGATFLAILGGTIAGGFAYTSHSATQAMAGAAVVLAVLTWLAARFIPASGEASPTLVVNRNPLISTVALIRDLKADRRLWVGGLITSWFWLVGIVTLSALPTLMKGLVGGSEGVVTLALVAFTVGIAIGSVAAARASKMRPNLALVPFATLLMGGFSIDLGITASLLTPPSGVTDVGGFLASVNGVHMLVDLVGLAAAGGLFIVPAFAAVQAWAPEDRRARVIAACNVLGAAFMTFTSLGMAALQAAGLGIPSLLIGLGLLNFAAFFLVLRAWGAEGVKDFGAFLFKTLLRLEVKGFDNIPKSGERVIIAPNHVSLLDAAILHSVLPAHAAFAIDTGWAQKWWVKPFLKLVRSHAVDPTKPMATRQLIAAVKEGGTLVIFPEGRLTVTGGLMKVYDGTAMIADKADALVCPVRIEGPERSPFGYLNRYQTKKALFPKTTVTFLPPVKLGLAPELKGRNRRQGAGAKLQDIMVNSAMATANIETTLFAALVEAKRTRDAGKPVIEDPMGAKLKYAKLILGAQVLGRKLAPMAGEGEAIGVLLPNSAGVAVTFFALQTIGRVPAMLNFTAGAQNLLAACTAAKVSTILTSRAFVEKARLTEVVAKLAAETRVVYLEDVKAEIGLVDKVAGLLLGSREQSARHPDDPAAILFTSGSEGLPKGVVLSHKNLLANATQCLTRVSANGADKVFNVMPVFHSFGLTGGLVMPLVGGVPVYLYPSPLHYRIVPELVYGSNSTILFGTDTFLTGYARAAHPYDFHRIRLIVSGAEAVKERTRAIYMEKFGCRILEGYGVTETAPVLALNTPLANKSGTVGRLAPMMEARLEPVTGIEEGGRLYVRGPNVMLGYYRAENPGVLEPPKDGWHDTGDIVSIDQNGFITIKGRAKRFAKIGGEMVSLAAVEALSAEAWPTHITVVVAMPDPRKGERLVLLTTDAKCKREDLQKLAKAKGLSELMLPAEIMVVPAIPLLGSGKPDFTAATQLVKSRTPSVATPPAESASPAAA